MSESVSNFEVIQLETARPPVVGNKLIGLVRWNTRLLSKHEHELLNLDGLNHSVSNCQK